MVQQIDRPFGLAGGDLGVKVRLGFSFRYMSHSSFPLLLQITQVALACKNSIYILPYKFFLGEWLGNSHYGKSRQKEEGQTKRRVF